MVRVPDQVTLITNMSSDIILFYESNLYDLMGEPTAPRTLAWDLGPSDLMRHAGSSNLTKTSHGGSERKLIDLMLHDAYLTSPL